MANATGKGGFTKGKSGNPGGLTPQQIRIRAKVQKKVFDAGEEAADHYIDEIRAGTKNGFFAAKDILDRVLGKATESLEITGKDGAPLVAVIRDSE